jgi:hypothetical protein
MNKSLFDLTTDALYLEGLLESIEGDITDAVVEEMIDKYLSELGDALNEKLDGYVTLVAEFSARAESRKKEADRLRTRAQVDQNNAERLKSRLKLYFERTGKTKVETARFTISLAKNGGKLPLIIADGTQPEALPEQFRKVKLEIHTDEVRAALEAGEELAFARFGERGTSIRIK